MIQIVCQTWTSKVEMPYYSAMAPACTPVNMGVSVDSKYPSTLDTCIFHVVLSYVVCFPNYVAKGVGLYISVTVSI